MSYNTRAGVRSNRPGYANSPASNNTNYNQNQYQNQNTTPSYTQPAYSTPTNYGQNKQPFSQNTPTQQQQTPAKAAAATAQHIPHTNPPPPPAKEVVQPPPAPAQQPEPKQEADVKGGEDSMDTSEDTPSSTPRGPKFRPWNKRGPAAKISRKLKKRRQNARLRNLLAPKNAMMVLHELHPELKMVISEQVNAANQTAYTVEIEVEGKLYRGHGMSKMAAKQVASENALKAVLLEKLEQNNLKINPDNTLSSEGAPNASGGESQQDVPMKEEGSAAAATAEGMEGEDGTAPVQRGRRPIEDDVPWGSLASFALFKLFAEWQSQGFQLPPSSLPPVFHKGFPTNEGVMISKMLMNTQHTSAAGAKKIPEDANKKHPVQLLNQIRPGSQYSESREGQPPNLTFKFTVQIDGQTFQGVGTNKRDAKKECAKRALEALGVKYE